MLTTLAVSLFGFVGVLTVGMFLFQNTLLYLPDRYPVDSLVQRTRDAALQPQRVADGEHIFAFLLRAFLGDIDRLEFEVLLHGDLQQRQIEERVEGQDLHVVDPPPLPVEKNPREFAAWVRARDLPVMSSYYSAYPDLTVQDILALRANLQPA